MHSPRAGSPKGRRKARTYFVGEPAENCMKNMSWAPRNACSILSLLVFVLYYRIIYLFYSLFAGICVFVGTTALFICFIV